LLAAIISLPSSSACSIGTMKNRGAGYQHPLTR
jgi:hypothetical protein